MSFNHSELLEKSPLSIVICDRSERVLWCNSRFLSDTHLNEDDVVGRLYASLPLEAIDKHAQLVKLFHDEAGEDIQFQYWHQPLDSPAGGRVHYFARERAGNSKIAALSAAKLSTTRLPKRASWVEFLDYEVSRSRRYDNPLSILKLHLLVFEKPDNVNQETLHQTINDTLMDELRWADMIGHTDRGSYLMVLPETPTQALEGLQNKLDKALKSQIGFISQAIKYQVVFGSASWQKLDDSQKLLKRARSSLVEQLESLLEQKS